MQPLLQLPDLRQSMIPQDYFAISRREIAPLLPAKAERVLDVGCGAGSTSAWLKTLYPSAHFIGLEGNASLLSTIGLLRNRLFEQHIFAARKRPRAPL